MPRKKVLDEEPEEEQYEWDKPRIILFFVILGALIIGGLFAKHFFLDSQNTTSSQSVQGITTANNTSLPSVQSVQHGLVQQLSNLQQQATKIDVKEIASSSPQVQEVIKQLQHLPQVPGDVARNTCEQICGKL